MRIFIQIFFSLSLLTTVNGQNYTVYHTGSNRDTITASEGGICMMGGSTEDDNAMRWFLQRAGGGDILVLRTSGSNGYNSYMDRDTGSIGGLEKPPLPSQSLFYLSIIMDILAILLALIINLPFAFSLLFYILKTKGEKVCIITK